MNYIPNNILQYLIIKVYFAYSFCLGTYPINYFVCHPFNLVIQELNSKYSIPNDKEGNIHIIIVLLLAISVFYFLIK